MTYATYIFTIHAGHGISFSNDHPMFTRARRDIRMPSYLKVLISGMPYAHWGFQDMTISELFEGVRTYTPLWHRLGLENRG